MTINNQWSNRYTMVEVTGLDRPGLLYELTATLSKLNLNIASAHVATFGERVVDVFYVTDLVGDQISVGDPPGGDQARPAAVVRVGRQRAAPKAAAAAGALTREQREQRGAMRAATEAIRCWLARPNINAGCRRVDHRVLNFSGLNG